MHKDLYDKILTAKAQLKRGTFETQKKGGGNFGDRWAPPQAAEGESPQSIILFPGDYKIPIKVGKNKELRTLERSYYVTYTHYYKPKNRGSTCSAGLRMEVEGGNVILLPGTDKCVGCHSIEDGLPLMTRRLLYVYNVILLGYYHLVDSDRVDPNGKPFKEWVSCEGKRCKYCNASIEKHFGRRVYWPAGQRFSDQLWDFINITLSQKCRCGGTLQPVGFQCAECGEPLRDLLEDPASNEELKTLRVGSMKCPKCGDTGIADEVSECDSCNKSRPMTIWDVQMSVVRTGKDLDSKLMISDWKPLSDQLLEKVKDRMKPYPFEEKLYKPQSLDEQAKNFGIPNPYSGESHSTPSGAVQWRDED